MRESRDLLAAEWGFAGCGMGICWLRNADERVEGFAGCGMGICWLRNADERVEGFAGCGMGIYWLRTVESLPLWVFPQSALARERMR